MVRLHKFIFSKNFSRKIFRNFHKIIFSPFCRLIKSLFILRPFFHWSTSHKKFLDIWNRFRVKNAKLLLPLKNGPKQKWLIISPFPESAHSLTYTHLALMQRKERFFINEKATVYIKKFDFLKFQPAC